MRAEKRRSFHTTRCLDAVRIEVCIFVRNERCYACDALLEFAKAVQRRVGPAFAGANAVNET
jgi:hypothetical protein